MTFKMCGDCDRWTSVEHDRDGNGHCHYHPPMLAIDTEGVVRQLRPRVSVDEMACGSGFIPRVPRQVVHS